MSAGPFRVPKIRASLAAILSLSVGLSPIVVPRAGSLKSKPLFANLRHLGIKTAD